MKGGEQVGFNDLCHPRQIRGGTMNEVNGGVERSETVN